MESDGTQDGLIPVSPPPAESTPQGRGEELAFKEAPAAKELDRFWAAVRRLPKYVKLAANLARDGDVPKSAKAALAVGGVYTVSPVDLVPGIIPVAGQLDDLLVLLFALRMATRACSPEVAQRHLERVGLEQRHFDDDLAATKDTARWLAGKGLSASRSIAAKSGRGIGRLWREHLRPGR
jgi:uncharacterized membrane protein YkvA (DUF1232 family)